MVLFCAFWGLQVAAARLFPLAFQKLLASDRSSPSSLQQATLRVLREPRLPVTVLQTKTRERYHPCLQETYVAMICAACLRAKVATPPMTDGGWEERGHGAEDLLT